jgi:hypothetical protein
MQIAGLLDQVMHVGVLGQQGRDQLSVEAGQLAIDRGGALLVGMHGGQDDDTITFIDQGGGDEGLPTYVDGRVQVRLAGGQGDDTIAALLSNRFADSSLYSIKLYGGVGDDLLTLLAEDVAGRFLIDGGRGRDTFLASDNVSVRRCEDPLNDIETIAGSLELAFLETG